MNKKSSTSNSFFQSVLNGGKAQYICLIVISIFFLYHYCQIFDPKPDMNGDNIYYYSLGKALADGEGFSNIMNFEKTPHTHFPPGYPVFIAGIMKFFPDNINAIKIANGILLYLSIILLFFLFKKLSGNITISLVSCILCTVQLQLLEFSTIMMSEMLYLFLTIVSMLIISHLFTPTFFSQKKYIKIILFVLLVFCTNYIYFVRTMGMSFVLSVLLYYGFLVIRGLIFWLKSKKAGQETRKIISHNILIFIILLFSFITCKTTWDIRDRNAGKTHNSYTSNFLQKANGQTMASKQDWYTRLKYNTTAYTTLWIPASIFSSEINSGEKIAKSDWIKGIICLFFFLIGIAKLKRLGLLIFFYIGATMGVLLLYPEQFTGFRYMVGIIPFFIFLFLYGAAYTLYYTTKFLLKKELAFSRFSITTALFAIFIIFPASLKALTPRKEVALYRTWNTQVAPPAFTEYIDIAQWCRKNLSDSARVICRKPEVFYMYSGGKKAGGFSQYGKPEDIFNSLVKNRATHVIVDHWFRHAYVTLYPLITDYYSDNFKFICQVGGKTPQEAPTLIFEFNPDWGYTGEKTDGKRQGQGKLVMQDGRVYIGTFRDNQINGYGELYDPKGELIAKGIWKNNSLTKPQ